MGPPGCYWCDVNYKFALLLLLIYFYYYCDWSLLFNVNIRHPNNQNYLINFWNVIQMSYCHILPRLVPPFSWGLFFCLLSKRELHSSEFESVQNSTLLYSIYSSYIHWMKRSRKMQEWLECGLLLLFFILILFVIGKILVSSRIFEVTRNRRGRGER